MVSKAILEAAKQQLLAQRAQLDQQIAEIDQHLSAPEEPQKPAKTTPKRRLSPEGRKRISEAQAKRWANKDPEPPKAGEEKAA